LRSLPGAYCLESEDGQERRPAHITDTLGAMVIPDHVGRLQVFVLDGVVLAHQCQRRLVVEISPLAARLLMRLRQ
jgi:hypothetical protein